MSEQENPLDDGKMIHIHTDGGTVVLGNVDTRGGDFVGRDQVSAQRAAEGMQAVPARPPLLLVWAEMPFELLERPPGNPAITINQWQAQALQPIAWPTRTIPPILILGLDPTDRLERAFAGAGAALSTVRGRGDVPTGNQPALLKLGGDLVERAGLWLSWQDVASTRGDADKAYLLAEAARVAQGGRVVIYAPSANEAIRRVWRDLLLPSLPGAEEYLAVGPGAAAALSLPDGGLSLDGALALPDGASMPGAGGGRAELEDLIRDSYEIIRDYERQIQVSDRPEEKLRARRLIAEQWDNVKHYWDQYRRVPGGVPPPDIAEIVAGIRL